MSGLTFSHGISSVVRMQMGLIAFGISTLFARYKAINSEDSRICPPPLPSITSSISLGLRSVPLVKGLACTG